MKWSDRPGVVRNLLCDLDRPDTGWNPEAHYDASSRTWYCMDTPSKRIFEDTPTWEELRIKMESYYAEWDRYPSSDRPRSSALVLLAGLGV